jgi:hypothetical protein
VSVRPDSGRKTLAANRASKAPMRPPVLVVCLTIGVQLLCWPIAAEAQSALSGEPIHISRAPASIVVDGDLSDEGWRGASRIDKWYEVNPGDNTEPKVRNVGYLTYDEKFFKRQSRRSTHARSRRRSGEAG